MVECLQSFASAKLMFRYVCDLLHALTFDAHVQQVGHSMHGLQEVTVCWYNAQEEEEEGKEQRGWYCGTTDGSEVTTKAK